MICEKCDNEMIYKALEMVWYCLYCHVTQDITQGEGNGRV